MGAISEGRARGAVGQGQKLWQRFMLCLSFARRHDQGRGVNLWRGVGQVRVHEPPGSARRGLRIARVLGPAAEVLLVLVVVVVVSSSSSSTRTLRFLRDKDDRAAEWLQARLANFQRTSDRITDETALWLRHK